MPNTVDLKNPADLFIKNRCKKKLREFECSCHTQLAALKIVQYCTGIGRIYRRFVQSQADRRHPKVCPVLDSFDAAGNELHPVPDREHHPLFEGEGKHFTSIAFAVIGVGVMMVGSLVRAYPRSRASASMFLSESLTRSPVKVISASSSCVWIKNKRFIQN